MRDNPLKWDDEAPQGVLSPFEGMDALGSGPDLSLLGLPETVSPIRARDLTADAVASEAVHGMMHRIAGALGTVTNGGPAWRRRIDGLSEDERAVLLDALGEGEVTMAISGGAPGEGLVQVHESVLPGIWIGRAEDDQGVVRSEWVETGDVPRVLREVAVSRPRDDMAVEALTPPEGAMNVMSVLSEIRSRAGAWQPGDANHVINFTLFPMTPADTAYLAKVLGEVGVRISSGGYGVARIIMTAFRNVWAVQYLNGMGTVILDTIEIGDVPDAVKAGTADFEDSAERLKEIMEAYVQ